MEGRWKTNQKKGNAEEWGSRKHIQEVNEH